MSQFTILPVFGNYRLQDTLGMGAMATVYLANLEGPNGFKQKRALKVIHPHLSQEPTYIRWFINEARLGGLLQHDHIVRTLEFGKEHNCFFIGMEYIEGSTLSRVIAHAQERQERLPLSTVHGLLEAMMKGLAYAHQATDDDGRPLKLIHRDLKPSNVLVGRRGEIKLADFGIARAESNEGTTTAAGAVKGTPRYMSPEQAAGDDLDQRSDVFSMGAIAYELLMGRALYPGENAQRVYQQAVKAEVDDPLSKLAADPERGDLVAFVARAIARKPSDRFASAEEMLHALEQQRPLMMSGPPLGRWLADTGFVWNTPRRTSAAPPTQPSQEALAATALHPEDEKTKLPDSSGASNPSGSGPRTGPRLVQPRFEPPPEPRPEPSHEGLRPVGSDRRRLQPRNPMGSAAPEEGQVPAPPPVQGRFDAPPPVPAKAKLAPGFPPPVELQEQKPGSRPLVAWIFGGALMGIGILIGSWWFRSASPQVSVEVPAAPSAEEAKLAPGAETVPSQPTLPTPLNSASVGFRPSVGRPAEEVQKVTPPVKEKQPQASGSKLDLQLVQRLLPTPVPSPTPAPAVSVSDEVAVAKRGSEAPKQVPAGVMAALSSRAALMPSSEAPKQVSVMLIARPKEPPPEVLVDGNLLGKSTGSWQVKLPPGEHRLEFRFEGLPPLTGSVVVSADAREIRCVAYRSNQTIDCQ